MRPPTPHLLLSNVLFGFYWPHSTLFSQITLRAFKESINFSILSGYLRCEAAELEMLTRETAVRATLVSPAPPDQSGGGRRGLLLVGELGVRCRLSAAALNNSPPDIVPVDDWQSAVREPGLCTGQAVSTISGISRDHPSPHTSHLTPHISPV